MRVSEVLLCQSLNGSVLTATVLNINYPHRASSLIAAQCRLIRLATKGPQ